ncbi:MAG: hypothetical protein NC110_08335 [Ruminococcus sp.]|nr:hypothetical protein [Ruminococcus sp.]
MSDEKTADSITPEHVTSTKLRLKLLSAERMPSTKRQNVITKKPKPKNPKKAPLILAHKLYPFITDIKKNIKNRARYTNMIAMRYLSKKGSFGCLLFDFPFPLVFVFFVPFAELLLFLVVFPFPVVFLFVAINIANASRLHSVMPLSICRKSNEK